MLVSVSHRILNWDAFQTRGQTLTSNVPAGLRPIQFFPSTDGTKATCHWETESLDELRRYIDGTLDDASSQEYFAVEERYAMGLPVPA